MPKYSLTKNQKKTEQEQGRQTKPPSSTCALQHTNPKPCSMFSPYESPTEMGWPEIPNGDREICRLISRRTCLICGLPGDQSTISSDSCLIFLTWLWIGTPFCANLSSLFIFMFSMLSVTQKKKASIEKKFLFLAILLTLFLYMWQSTIYNTKNTSHGP